MVAGRNFWICCAFVLITNQILLAQESRPPLERTVTIRAVNEPLESVLDQLAREGHFSFSYNPDILDTKKRITLVLVNKTVREALEQISGESLRYKAKGEHVILTKAPPPPVDPAPSFFLISGYVTDGNSGEKIPDVTIYDKETQASSLTDTYGFYQIKVDRKSNAVQLVVNKQDFKDTIIYVRQTGHVIINLTIFPEEQPSEPADTLRAEEKIRKLKE